MFLSGLFSPRCGSCCPYFLQPVHGVLVPEAAGSWEWQHRKPWLFCLLLWGAGTEKIHLSPCWARLETALCIWCFKRTMLSLSSPKIYNLAKCDWFFFSSFSFFYISKRHSKIPVTSKIPLLKYKGLFCCEAICALSWSARICYNVYRMMYVPQAIFLKVH